MSKEQIEEMKVDVFNSIAWKDLDDGVAALDVDRTTENLHSKGYRKQEWISVDERLPDGNGRFLIVDRLGGMMVCYWEKRFGWFFAVCSKNAITHWMPLPEAPKMKGGE